MSRGDDRERELPDEPGADQGEATPEDAPEVVELPITDTLDLHSFRPREVADVVRDYLDAAWERGLRELRIVHGRGIGVQREIVRKVLERDARVCELHDAPPEAGGWGATLVKLSD